MSDETANVTENIQQVESNENAETVEAVEKTDEAKKPSKNGNRRKKNFAGNGKIFANLPKDDQRFYNLLHVIFSMCTLAGFRIEGRLTIRDLKTGKLWS